MKLNWQYSRNQRRHWVEDGEFYGKNYARLFEIKDCARYGFIHKPADGYDLRYKGKKIGHAKTVKELKGKALDWHITAESFKNERKVKEATQKTVPPS